MPWPDDYHTELEVEAEAGEPCFRMQIGEAEEEAKSVLVALHSSWFVALMGAKAVLVVVDDESYTVEDPKPKAEVEDGNESCIAEALRPKEAVVWEEGANSGQGGFS